MRKTAAVFFLLLLGNLAARAQRLDTLPTDTKQRYLQYMKKRSTYKTIGFVLLGTGVTLFGTAYLINVENGWNGPTKAEGMFNAGLISAALSPPLFILAASTKRKAKLVLKNEHLTSAIHLQSPCFPAVSLRVGL